QTRLGRQCCAKVRKKPAFGFQIFLQRLRKAAPRSSPDMGGRLQHLCPSRRMTLPSASSRCCLWKDPAAGYGEATAPIPSASCVTNGAASFRRSAGTGTAPDGLGTDHLPARGSSEIRTAVQAAL